MDTNDMREIARILDDGESDYLYQRASNALLIAAEEIDKLRAKRSQAEHWHSFYRPQIAALEDMTIELQATLALAPHDADCAQETYDGHDESIECTCWKGIA